MKRENNFILYSFPLKIILLILIAVIFSIIPARAILASPSPLTYVPLNSYIYPAIFRFDALGALDGNTDIPLHTLPLTRIEVTYLVDIVLSNLQRGRIELKEADLYLMDRLVNEFQDELASIGVNIILLNASDEELTKNISSDWLYEYLKYFKEGDILKDPSNLLNPQMSRRDMSFLVNEIIYSIQIGEVQINDFTGEDLEKLEALVVGLDDELSAQGLKIVKLNKTTVILDTLQSTFKIVPYFTQKINLLNPGQGEESKQTQKLSSISELGVKASASISENSAFYLDTSLCTDIDLGSGSLISESEGEISFKAKVNQAYIKLKLPSWEIPTPTDTAIFPSLSNLEFPVLDLGVGRDYMRWGPGYQGSLILSNNAPAFDMLKYSGTIDLDNYLAGNWGAINFTKFFSLLDPLEEQKRYFLGQRLEYKPFDALTLGLSETAVISRDPSISTILFYNPIPFIPPYVVTRIIANKLGISSVINSYVAIDAELNFQPGIKLYGELMIDDLHFEPEYLHPNRTGFLAGVYFVDPLDTGNTDFRIEYTHINNYVYFHTESWQDYLYQGEYIGNPLGPDADQLYLELTHRLSDKFNLSLSYNHQRHGEGQAGIALPSDPVVANENIFLSGIIEKKKAYQAGISYTMSPQWELSAGVTWESIKNKDNDSGTNENNTYLQMELKYQF